MAVTVWRPIICPLFAPEKFTMPVAITVGEKDTIVPPQSTLQLAEAIKKKGNRNVLVIARKDGGAFERREVKLKVNVGEDVIDPEGPTLPGVTLPVRV